MINDITNDTIAAIATPPGTGSIGIVRLSGYKASEIAKKIFVGKDRHFEPNKVCYGWVYDGENPVDEVILLYFRAPNSFTGENVIEIQCHGGTNIVKKILNLCLIAGARLANRGEFSKRAFMNGKMDLSKAESVLDLIHARTDRFLQESAFNLSGKLRKKTGELRKELLDLLSLITAAVDFPEDVDEPEYSVIYSRTKALIAEIERVLSGAAASNIMRDGVKVVIAGRPNAGKSSLFNAILDSERAIVTDIPGTTRDIIRESVDIDGIPVVLTDTAGLRELEATRENYIESLGIGLTRQVIAEADVVLYVYDLIGGMPADNIDEYGKKTIIIGAKADLAGDIKLDNAVIPVSSVKKTGIDRLKQEIKNIISAEELDSEFCTNLRQQQCLKNAKTCLKQTLDACDRGDPQDLISIELKSALLSLGEITGEIVSEEILENIFSNFCIGK